MVYRGYEATCYFVKLLQKYPNDMMNHLNDTSLQVFTAPLFQPQFTAATDAIPNYFENRKLYFMRTTNGVATKAW